MRFLGAALVCIAVLYAVDAQFFGGQYKDGMRHALSDILRHWFNAGPAAMLAPLVACCTSITIRDVWAGRLLGLRLSSLTCPAVLIGGAFFVCRSSLAITKE